MAPKRNARDITPAASGAASSAAATSSPVAPVAKASKTSPATAAASSAQSWDKVVVNLVNYYQEQTPQRTKLIDAFMAFLVAVGGLQFVYCVLAGNYVRLLGALGTQVKFSK